MFGCHHPPHDSCKQSIWMHIRDMSSDITDYYCSRGISTEESDVGPEEEEEDPNTDSPDRDISKTCSSP